jgi:universal stress protein E
VAQAASRKLAAANMREYKCGLEKYRLMHQIPLTGQQFPRQWGCAMASITQILVASDVTGRSDRALVRAVQLKRELAATLTLLHVVEHGLAPEIAQRRRVESIDILDARMLDISEASLRHVVIEALIGDPFATIVGEAEARHADLIVLGEPGKQRLKDLFVGTTTERVIRHSERPVLVVKEASGEAYRRVLVAFDLSEGAGRVLETALTVAPHAEFRLVHVCLTTLVRIVGREVRTQETLTKETERTRNVLEDKARQAISRSGSPHRMLNIETIEGSPACVIRDELIGYSADLLAVGTHGRGTLQAAIFGSLARDLVAEVSCDVLVTRP